MLYFSAMFSQKCKFGLIKRFLYRAYMIRNSWLLFSNEVDFLRDVFLRMVIVKNCLIHMYANFLISNMEETVLRKRWNMIKLKQFFKFFTLYLPSVIFGRKLKRHFKDYYCIDVKVVFSSLKVNFFSEMPYPYTLDVQCRKSIYMFA